MHKKIKKVTRFIETVIVLVFFVTILLIKTQVVVAIGFLISLLIVTVGEYYLWLRPVFKDEKMTVVPETEWYEGTSGNWAG